MELANKTFKGTEKRKTTQQNLPKKFPNTTNEGHPNPYTHSILQKLWITLSLISTKTHLWKLLFQTLHKLNTHGLETSFKLFQMGLHKKPFFLLYLSLLSFIKNFVLFFFPYVIIAVDKINLLYKGCVEQNFLDPIYSQNLKTLLSSLVSQAFLHNHQWWQPKCHDGSA